MLQHLEYEKRQKGLVFKTAYVYCLWELWGVYSKFTV